MFPSEPVPYRIRAFQVPKQGEAPASCEDAYRVRGTPTSWDGAPRALPVRRLRAVVTDGATQSSFPGAWARLIASGLVVTGPPLSEAAFLERKLARLAVAWRKEAEACLPQPRNWWQDTTLESGAFSSLLSFEVERGAWEAQAVGDTCLFQIRDDEILRAFPLERPEEFDRRPHLLSSIPYRNHGLAARLHRAEGRAEPMDLFLLATDALARWILEFDGWIKVLQQCQGSGMHQAFAHLVSDERRAGRLQDDDSTLVTVGIP